MLDREKVINELVKHIEIALSIDSDYVDCVRTDLLQHTVALLKEQEAVIRCKDCKHATMTADGKMCKYCEMDTDDFGYPRNVYHDANWFCADGEREEGQ